MIQSIYLSNSIEYSCIILTPRFSGFVPHSSFIRVLSPHPIKSMSVLNYLQSVKKWDSQVIQLQTPTLTGRMYHILAQVELNITGHDARTFFSLCLEQPEAQDSDQKNTKIPKEQPTSKDNRNRRKDNDVLKTNERSSSGKYQKTPLNLFSEDKYLKEEGCYTQERYDISRKLGLLQEALNHKISESERTQSGNSKTRYKVADTSINDRTQHPEGLKNREAAGIQSCLLEKLVQYRLIKIFDPSGSGSHRNSSDSSKLPGSNHLNSSAVSNNSKKMSLLSQLTKVNKKLNCENGKTDQLDPRISSDGLFHDSLLISQGPACPNFQLKLSPGRYMLIFESTPFRDFEPENLELKAAWKGNLQLRQNPALKYLNYSGYYKPNKYYSLFKDRLIFKEDSVAFSLHLQLFNQSDAFGNSEDIHDSPSFDQTQGFADKNSKSRKKKEESKQTEIDLRKLRPLKRDVHVILELLHKDKVVHRFGGSREVLVSTVRINRHGIEIQNKKTELNHLTKANENDELQPQPSEIQKLEANFKFPKRMMSSSKQGAKSKKEKSKNTQDPKSTNTWRPGDWTLRAFLEPRGSRMNFQDEQSEGRTSRLEDHLPHPNRVMYFDLERSNFHNNGQNTLLKSHERDHHIPGSENLVWMMRIITSDELQVAPDTRKQEMQRKLIRGWELREPGRSQRGKAARELFLLKQKAKSQSLSTAEAKTLSELQQEINQEMSNRLNLESEPHTQNSKSSRPAKDKKHNNKTDNDPQQTNSKNHALNIILNQDMHTPASSDDLERTEDLKSFATLLTSKNSFSKTIRNLCRKWEGPKNLFIASGESKILLTDDYTQNIEAEAQQRIQTKISFQNQCKTRLEEMISTQKSILNHSKWIGPSEQENNPNLLNLDKMPKTLQSKKSLKLSRNNSKVSELETEHQQNQQENPHPLSWKQKWEIEWDREKAAKQQKESKREWWQSMVTELDDLHKKNSAQTEQPTKNKKKQFKKNRDSENIFNKESQNEAKQSQNQNSQLGSNQNPHISPYGNSQTPPNPISFRNNLQKSSFGFHDNFPNTLQMQLEEIEDSQERDRFILEQASNDCLLDPSFKSKIREIPLDSLLEAVQGGFKSKVDMGLRERRMVEFLKKQISIREFLAELESAVKSKDQKALDEIYAKAEHSGVDLPRREIPVED